MHNNNQIPSSSDHYRRGNGQDVVRGASRQDKRAPRDYNSHNGPEERFSAQPSAIRFSYEVMRRTGDKAVDNIHKPARTNGIRNFSTGFSCIRKEQRTILSGQTMSEIRPRSNRSRHYRIEKLAPKRRGRKDRGNSKNVNLGQN